MTTTNPGAQYLYGALVTTTADLKRAVEKVHGEAQNVRDAVRMGQRGDGMPFLAKYAAEAAEQEARRDALVTAARAVGMTDDEIQAAIKEGLRRDF